MCCNRKRFYWSYDVMCCNRKRFYWSYDVMCWKLAWLCCYRKWSAVSKGIFCRRKLFVKWKGFCLLEEVMCFFKGKFFVTGSDVLVTERGFVCYRKYLPSNHPSLGTQLFRIGKLQHLLEKIPDAYISLQQVSCSSLPRTYNEARCSTYTPGA